jgi:hypothetical protein
MIGEIKLMHFLEYRGINEELINDVIDSGYFLRWSVNLNGETIISVGDKLYGNKLISSNFEIEDFIKYITQQPVTFEHYPFNTFNVKTYEEIIEILNKPERKRYMDSGRLSFRGQSNEYFIKRKIPNPIRKDFTGKEISILPGSFRKRKLDLEEDLPLIPKATSTLEYFMPFFVPKGTPYDIAHSYDFRRVEQHYCSQTDGLDITFDIQSAIYFATHKYQEIELGKATYNKIDKGDHKGVIYCFVFTDPPVKKTEYLIKDFDVFKINKPERILRQHCGLPLFNEYERNIALTDINCIIYLDSDFDYSDGFSYEYMFPKEKDDSFYCKLMEIKKMNMHPRLKKFLENIVEYV